MAIRTQITTPAWSTPQKLYAAKAAVFTLSKKFVTTEDEGGPHLFDHPQVHQPDFTAAGHAFPPRPAFGNGEKLTLGRRHDKALMPAKELHRYSSTLRSLTGGCGLHKEEFSHYEEKPREAEAILVEEYERHRAELDHHDQPRAQMMRP